MKRHSQNQINQWKALLVWFVGLSFWMVGERLADFLALPTQAATSKAESAGMSPETASSFLRSEDIHLMVSAAVPTTYTGPVGLREMLMQHLARPTALTSADFDEDGVPDVLIGYVGPSGGLLTLHRGNLEALWPRRQATGTTPHRSGSMDAPPFLPHAAVFELQDAPDFLGAGDFDADGHQDVAAAARGGHALYLLPGDGRGGFESARQIPLPGGVTALTVGEVNRADGLTDLVVGVQGPDGPQALIFEGPEGALKSEPEVIRLSATVTALALGQLDDSFEMDLVIAAGNQLLIVHGRDRRLSLDELRQAEVPEAKIEQHALEFAITAVAPGDFLADRAHRTELALLADDGTVRLASRAKGKRQVWSVLSSQ